MRYNLTMVLARRFRGCLTVAFGRTGGLTFALSDGLAADALPIAPPHV